MRGRGGSACASARRVCVCVCASARGGGLRLSGSECGFSPIFAPVSRTPPRLAGKTTPTPPRYPCFALADLIRDSALNLVRYMAVCMPRLALPATSATHTLSHPLSLSIYLLPARITYLPSGAHAHACACTYIYDTRPYPGSRRLLFPPCSPSFSRASDRYTPPTLFFPPSSVSLALFLSLLPY